MGMYIIFMYIGPIYFEGIDIQPKSMVEGNSYAFKFTLVTYMRSTHFALGYQYLEKCKGSDRSTF